MKNFICICGFITKNSGKFGSHKKYCDNYKEAINFLENQKEKIIEIYNKTGDLELAWSNTIVPDNFDQHHQKNIFSKSSYCVVRGILKSAGVYDPFNKKKMKSVQKKLENTCKEKYGVTNISKISNSFELLNKIPYEKLKFDEEFSQYKAKSGRLAKKYHSKNKNSLPEYCFFTGIQFADVDGDVNPNDPRKRSLDHRIPVLLCFLQGIPVEECSSEKNLCYVLRYVNSVKGNTDEKSFLTLAPFIRQRFINEGYKHK